MAPFSIIVVCSSLSRIAACGPLFKYCWFWPPFPELLVSASLSRIAGTGPPFQNCWFWPLFQELLFAAPLSRISACGPPFQKCCLQPPFQELLLVPPQSGIAGSNPLPKYLDPFLLTMLRQQRHQLEFDVIPIIFSCIFMIHYFLLYSLSL